MKRWSLLLLFLFAASLKAQIPGVLDDKQVIDKSGANAKLQTFVDYQTSQTAGTVLQAPCTGAAGRRHSRLCVFKRGALSDPSMISNKMVCMDDLFYRSGASYACGVSMVNQGTAASNASGSTLGAATIPDRSN